MLDSLLHGQAARRRAAARARAWSCIVGDVRDAGARAARPARRRRGRAPRRDRRRPRLRAATRPAAQAVNVDAARALVAGRRATPASSASCSPRPARTTGAWPIPTVPITEDGAARAGLALRRAEGRRRAARCSALDPAPFAATCLRFATVYGVAPRMRFDLTVNEFTRDLWADRRLEVFGEQFWRPYVHVRDAARGVRAVLDAPVEPVAGEVFNVGDTGENYRKLDLVELIRRRRIAARSSSCTARGPARLQGGVRQDRRAARLPSHADRARRDRRDHRRARARTASRTPSMAGTGTSPERPALRPPARARGRRAR